MVACDCYEYHTTFSGKKQQAGENFWEGAKPRAAGSRRLPAPGHEWLGGFAPSEAQKAEVGNQSFGEALLGSDKPSTTRKGALFVQATGGRSPNARETSVVRRADNFALSLGLAENLAFCEIIIIVTRRELRRMAQLGLRLSTKVQTPCGEAPGSSFAAAPPSPQAGTARRPSGASGLRPRFPAQS